MYNKELFSLLFKIVRKYSSARIDNVTSTPPASITTLLRSTKEERFLISWATCDRVGFLCTQAKADPCFFVRSVGRPGVHLFSAILNDVTISLRKGCCLVNDVTISLRKGCCLVLRSLSDVRERGCPCFAVCRTFENVVVRWCTSFIARLLLFDR